MLTLGLVILLCTGGTPNLVASGTPVSETFFLVVSNPVENFIGARLAGGLIMVQARLNGQLGNYILDTGASHLFVNQDLVNEKTVQAYGVGEQVSVQSGLVARFEIGPVTFSDQLVYKMDMRHLEAVKGCRIDGIIGTELLKKFTLFVDYENGKVQLTPADQFTTNKTLTALRTHPFKMQGHFPMLSISVNAVEYEFALDTGAEANIFSGAFEQAITTHTRELRTGKVRTISQSPLPVRNFTLTEMECLGLHYSKLGFMFSDLKALNQAYGVELDGILGYPFLRRHPFTIDFSQGRLVIWE